MAKTRYTITLEITVNGNSKTEKVILLHDKPDLTQSSFPNSPTYRTDLMQVVKTLYKPNEDVRYHRVTVVEKVKG